MFIQTSWNSYVGLFHPHTRLDFFFFCDSPLNLGKFRCVVGSLLVVFIWFFPPTLQFPPSFGVLDVNSQLALIFIFKKKDHHVCSHHYFIHSMYHILLPPHSASKFVELDYNLFVEKNAFREIYIILEFIQAFK